MLTHYIIVRRDLPLGVLAAMITHAAGESAAMYDRTCVSPFKGCRAVVLEVKTEADLLDVHERLINDCTDHRLVCEDSGPYAGQAMAIGLEPVDSDIVGEDLSDLQTLKKLDEPGYGHGV